MTHAVLRTAAPNHSTLDGQAVNYMLQVEKLRALHDNAHLNGAVDVRWISVEEARDMEPELHCLAAMFSPSTGIVDGKQWVPWPTCHVPAEALWRWHLHEAHGPANSSQTNPLVLGALLVTWLSMLVA